MIQNAQGASAQTKTEATDMPQRASGSLGLVFSKRRVVGTLAGIAVFLLVAGFLCLIAQLYLPDFFGRDLFIGLFDLNGESNIPATFSALILLLAALILGVIAWAKRRSESADAFAWKALTFIFSFLALDEAAMLHERTADITRSMVKTDGILHYAWVVPYGILVVVVGLSFVRFLLHLPAHIRLRVIVAGAMYIMGALGLELLEGLVVSTEGVQNLLNQSMVVLEEGMEMFGVILFIGALLSYVTSYLPDLKLQLNVDTRQ